MSFRLARTRITVGYEVVAAITAVLILDRENRVICCLIAAALHELGHLLLMRRFHVPVRSVTFRLFDRARETVETETPAIFARSFIVINAFWSPLLHMAFFLENVFPSAL